MTSPMSGRAKSGLFDCLLDLHPRRVIGWTISNRMKKDLAISALNMAIALGRPRTGCIHHTDTSSQYCLHNYQKILCNHGLVVVMRGKGNRDDNSTVESFFKSLKAELVWHRSCRTRRYVRVDLFAYINGLYNPRRRHSACSWKSPVAFERKPA